MGIWKKSITVLFPIIFLILFSTQNVFAPPTFDEVYTADVLPELAGFPTVEDSGCTLREINPAGVYHYTSVDVGFCLQTSPSWNADKTVGFTLEARIKVNSASNPSGSSSPIGLWATSIGSEAVLEIGPTQIHEFHSTNTFSMVTTDSFHTYRITVLGNDFIIYVARNLSITRNIKFF